MRRTFAQMLEVGSKSKYCWKGIEFLLSKEVCVNCRLLAATVYKHRCSLLWSHFIHYFLKTIIQAVEGSWSLSWKSVEVTIKVLRKGSSLQFTSVLCGIHECWPLTEFIHVGFSNTELVKHLLWQQTSVDHIVRVVVGNLA